MSDNSDMLASEASEAVDIFARPQGALLRTSSKVEHLRIRIRARSRFDLPPDCLPLTTTDLYLRLCLRPHTRLRTDPPLAL